MAVSGAEGAASNTPWSGHWWPALNSKDPNLYDPGQALQLYDQYVQRTRGYNPGAQDWERQNHGTTDPTLDWAGSCHAWAAASILTQGAPTQGVNRGGLQFNQDQLEGLITSVYFNPTYEILPGGVRSNTDDPNAAEFKDMNPAWMHYLLQYYLQQNHSPFIMDIAAGSQVWNFPVFAFQSNQRENQDGSVDFATRVWYSDAKLGEAQTQPMYRDYSYRLRNTADGKMTGDWTGKSQTDHPDFAWVPTGKAEGGGKNPRVDERVVEEILGYPI